MADQEDLDQVLRLGDERDRARAIVLRLAAMSPWEQAMDYSNACFFCEALLGDDMDESKVTHADDCLWQQAVTLRERQ